MSQLVVFGEMKCLVCGNSVFRVPDEVADDPIIKCKCGAVLGPLYSLKAKATGSAHTPVNATAEKELKSKG